MIVAILGALVLILLSVIIGALATERLVIVKRIANTDNCVEYKGVLYILKKAELKTDGPNK